MKKLLAIVLILLAFVSIYVLHSTLPDFYFAKGKEFYNKKDYKNSSVYLKKALRLKDSDRQIRYFYVQSLINLPPTLEVQKELFKISQQNFSDTADLLADRQISKWKNQIFLNIGENYIEQVPFNNKILRWDISKFPLKVYFDQSQSDNLPSYYIPAIKKAFAQWPSSTGYIKIKFIDTSKDADIVVKIVTPQRNSCSNESCKYVVAYTTPSVANDVLKKIDIVFYDSNNLGDPFPEKDVYNTALHEIGHALGIMGHSYNKTDLMYMQSDSNDNSYNAQFRSDFQVISEVDLNTLKLLYMMIPDITNTNMPEYDTRKQFYAPIILGSGEEVNSRKLEEAKNYIKSAPNLPNGYIDLAAAYAEKKEYTLSLDSLAQALGLASNDEERFIIYYNYAVIYMNIQDWENSLKYADMAKAIKPSSDIEGLIAAVNFNKGNTEFAKSKYIETLEKDPSNALDAVNLARIYLRELNFVQAGKVLNKMVKANPSAKQDPLIKPFGFIMFLFR